MLKPIENILFREKCKGKVNTGHGEQIKKLFWENTAKVFKFDGSCNQGKIFGKTIFNASEHFFLKACC